MYRHLKVRKHTANCVHIHPLNLFRVTLYLWRNRDAMGWIFVPFHLSRALATHLAFGNFACCIMGPM